MPATKPDVHKHIATPSEEDGTTAIGNIHVMHGKLGELWTCSFWDMLTDRDTDTFMAVLHTDTEGIVMNFSD